MRHIASILLAPIFAFCIFLRPQPIWAQCGTALEECNDGDCCDLNCRILPLGTSCRGVVGLCDQGEQCDGIDPKCPDDAFEPAGIQCSSRVCHEIASCTGDSPDCPEVVPLPDGSSCRDRLTCNGDETCLAGECQEGTPINCDDDDNLCTVGTCEEPGECVVTTLENCCNVDADCNDNDDCTLDTCPVAGGSCRHVVQASCACAFDTDCNDNDPCTIDTCDTNSSQCTYASDPNCSVDAGSNGTGDSGNPQSGSNDAGSPNGSVDSSFPSDNDGGSGVNETDAQGNSNDETGSQNTDTNNNSTDSELNDSSTGILDPLDGSSLDNPTNEDAGTGTDTDTQARRYIFDDDGLECSHTSIQRNAPMRIWIVLVMILLISIIYQSRTQSSDLKSKKEHS